VTVKRASAIRSLFLALAGGAAAHLAAQPARADTPLNGIDCGSAGSSCEILASNIPNPRSMSEIQAGGSFFVGSAGSPTDDLFQEAVTGKDSDSSTIYRYTDADGLKPWIGKKPSQLITEGDPTLGFLVPYQGGINGVAVDGNDLVYSLSYNRGASNYVDRMRSYTVETGLSFGEVRRVRGGATDPNGPETIIADLGRAEVENDNPDGALIAFKNLTHNVGDPEFETNPYGVLSHGNRLYAVDAAANDLYRINPDGSLELFVVFTRFLSAFQPVPTNLIQGPGGKLYATIFRCVNFIQSGALGAIVQIKGKNKVQAVSFNSLPVSAAFGPDRKLYVLEYANQFSPNTGRVLRTTPRAYADFNGRSVSDGSVVVDKLNYPVDLKFDDRGRLVVLDSAEPLPYAATGRILRFTLGGR
jgi:hypothetical protein